ncbi:MAG: 16S rRNA (cytosine(1402)-N(4))-methyltransferase RsmH [Candidatus Omnitrophica bacterium]|nr:16S rRNA (cytosine(1402)-N(4))-methyltransferase RsmH [Candidatus Omnitrophota bacterium]
MPHKPVLLKEALELLHLGPGSVVVDGTLGSGGHSLEILKQMDAEGCLIALDQDPESLKRCQPLFEKDSRVSLHHSNYLEMDQVLERLNVKAVDAVILDIGVSLDQLESSERGFSFLRIGPLDMRMNPYQSVSARDLIHDLSQKELEAIFRNYGEERLSRKFSERICKARESERIETTEDLIRVLLGRRSGTKPAGLRRHPATKVFQALRIAVNDELEVLKEGLPRIWKSIKVGGRLVVLSFHSLEDRIVKQTFREWARSGEAFDLTKKPMMPTREEMRINRQSRSAKLRAVEKIR